jgi:hypothetical protein
MAIENQLIDQWKASEDRSLPEMAQTVTDKSRVDISREKKRVEIPEGEVSSWFPSGKFLGMKVPKGTKNIISSLTLLAIGVKGKPQPGYYMQKPVKEVFADMQKLPVKMQKDVFSKILDNLKKHDPDEFVKFWKEFNKKKQARWKAGGITKKELAEQVKLQQEYADFHSAIRAKEQLNLKEFGNKMGIKMGKQLPKIPKVDVKDIPEIFKKVQ